MVRSATITLTLAVLVAPAASVMLAVIVWAPAERRAVVSIAPVPSAPSRSELQAIALPISPSSSSLACAASSSGTPVNTAAPSRGASIAIVGYVFGGRTTTVRTALAVRPPASATVAVTWCVPTCSVLVKKPAPLPIGPSRSEVQPTCADRSPSVMSMARAAKLTPRFANKSAPSTGASIVTTGGVGATVKRTVADPGVPSESVTEAVRRCVPSRRTTVRGVPEPSGPARSELHWTRPLTSPSKSSVAVAASETGVPAGTAAPPAGTVMVTTGAAFGARTRSWMCASVRTPPASLTAAVMVWRPTLSAPVTRGPVPSGPSMLEVHASAAPRSPSSPSAAVPAKVIGPTDVNTTAPSAGVSIATTGGRSTTTVVVASAVIPLGSATCAVTVCGPGLRVATDSVAPLPRTPSRSDVHWIRRLRSPLSASRAAPAKTIGTSDALTAPGTGAVIATTGAVSGFSVSSSWGFLALSRLW